MPPKDEPYPSNPRVHEDSTQLRAAYDGARAASSVPITPASTDSLRATPSIGLGDSLAPNALSTTQTRATQTRDATAEGSRVTAVGLQPTEVLASRYEIRRVLGHGGMGAVYEAYDRLKRENVAIKVLLPELLTSDHATERFINEAKIGCKLSHPNIIKVFDVGVSPPYYFITMELLEGQTLRHQLNTQQHVGTPLSIEQFHEYATQLIDALEYVRHSIVHRDLKPANIWVDTLGRLKLMDFGISRALSNSDLTRTGMVMGTAYYMAPEQWTGAKDVDWRADQYSFGVILYELLTGHLPQGTIRPPRAVRSDVAPGISTAIMKMLSPLPSERFQDFPSLRAALQPRYGTEKHSRTRRRWVIAATATACLTLTALFFPPVAGRLPGTPVAKRWETQALQGKDTNLGLLSRTTLRQRQLEDAAASTQATIDRLNNRLLLVASDSERGELSNQLTSARRESRLAIEALTIAKQSFFGAKSMAEAKDQQVLAEDLLRDGRPQQALTALQASRTQIDLILRAADSLESAVKRRDDLRITMDRAEKLVASQGGKVDEVFAPIRSQLPEANRLLETGDTVTAQQRFDRLLIATKSTSTRFLKQVAANYAAIAQKSMNANDLDTAQAALSKAKEINKLAEEYR